MSLKKKYTWNDFLKAHPEHKQKKSKRTAKDVQKAFDSAFKQHAKEYLKDRLAKIEKEKKRATDKKSALGKNLKAAKAKTAANNIKTRIGAMSAYLTRLDKIQEKTKALQKNI